MKTKPRNYDNWQDKAIARIGDIKKMCGKDNNVKTSVYQTFERLTSTIGVSGVLPTKLINLAGKVLASQNTLAIEAIPGLLTASVSSRLTEGSTIIIDEEVLISTLETLTGATIPREIVEPAFFPSNIITAKGRLLNSFLEGMGIIFSRSETPEIEYSKLQCIYSQLSSSNDNEKIRLGNSLLFLIASGKNPASEELDIFNLFFQEDPEDFSSCLVEN